jgi:hypothetical protein
MFFKNLLFFGNRNIVENGNACHIVILICHLPLVCVFRITINLNDLSKPVDIPLNLRKLHRNVRHKCNSAAVAAFFDLDQLQVVMVFLLVLYWIMRLMKFNSLRYNIKSFNYLGIYLGNIQKV